MIRLASHNSLTYLPAKKWWLAPLKFMAQCQSKTLKEQYDLGVRMFDVRVVFEDDKVCPAHGLMVFKGDVLELLKEMNEFGEKVYCRILNERDKNYDKYVKFCEYIQKTYTNIIFLGGHNKKDWKLLYNFGNPGVGSIDKYSSWNNDTKLGTGWHLDDWFPRLYAMCFNKMWRKKLGNEKTFLMQDFVGVY